MEQTQCAYCKIEITNEQLFEHVTCSSIFCTDCRKHYRCLCLFNDGAPPSYTPRNVSVLKPTGVALRPFYGNHFVPTNDAAATNEASFCNNIDLRQPNMEKNAAAAWRGVDLKKPLYIICQKCKRYLNYEQYIKGNQLCFSCAIDQYTDYHRSNISLVDESSSTKLQPLKLKKKKKNCTIVVVDEKEENNTELNVVQLNQQLNQQGTTWAVCKTCMKAQLVAIKSANDCFFCISCDSLTYHLVSSSSSTSPEKGAQTLVQCNVCTTHKFVCSKMASVVDTFFCFTCKSNTNHFKFFL